MMRVNLQAIYSSAGIAVVLYFLVKGGIGKDGKMYHANARKTGNCLATLHHNLIAELRYLAGLSIVRVLSVPGVLTGF
jgi:hypothetical protein